MMQIFLFLYLGLGCIEDFTQLEGSKSKIVESISYTGMNLQFAYQKILKQNWLICQMNYYTLLHIHTPIVV